MPLGVSSLLFFSLLSLSLSLFEFEASILQTPAPKGQKFLIHHLDTSSSGREPPNGEPNVLEVLQGQDASKVDGANHVEDDLPGATAPTSRCSDPERGGAKHPGRCIGLESRGQALSGDALVLNYAI